MKTNQFNASKNIRASVLFVLFLFTTCWANKMNAQPKAYEGFDYTVGNLAGNAGGSGWSGAWLGGGTVSSPGYTFTGCASVGNSSALNNTQASRFLSEGMGAIGTTLWIGYILAENTNGVILHFQLRQDAKVNMDIYRINYDQWGLDSDGTGDADNLPWFNEKTKPHFWLIKLVFGESNTNVTVWQDPLLASEPTSGGTTVTLPAFTFNNIQLIQQVAAGSTASSFDEIRVADNFMNATNNNPVISTSVQQTEGASNLLRVFPTVTNGLVHLTLANQLIGGEIQLYNSLGEVFNLGRANEANISLTLEKQLQGLYLLSVQRGNVRSIQRILLHK